MGELLAVWKTKITDTGRNRWLIILLLGLLMIVIALPVSSDSEIKEESEDLWETKEETVDKTLLEQKLAELLESVEGVGEVRVMIMTGEGEAENFYSSGTETVTGVLISAEGADSFVTVKNIQDAVMALFQVDAHKIKVMKMK